MSKPDIDNAGTVPMGQLSGGVSTAERSAEPMQAEDDPVVTSAATIGRYVIAARLGRGGMGTVYAAYDGKLDRRVALKLLNARASEAGSGRLAREAVALAQLSHPNIVHVYDTGIYQKRLFVAMELIDGQPLNRWIEGEPRPSWRQVLDVYLQAAPSSLPYETILPCVAEPGQNV